MASALLSSIIGGGISGVQRGASVFSGSTTVNVAISSIDIAKSFVTTSVDRPEDGTAGHPGEPGTRLDTSTNLVISGDVATAVTVYWEVVTFK